MDKRFVCKLLLFRCVASIKLSFFCIVVNYDRRQKAPLNLKKIVIKNLCESSSSLVGGTTARVTEGNLGGLRLCSD